MVAVNGPVWSRMTARVWRSWPPAVPASSTVVLIQAVIPVLDQAVIVNADFIDAGVPISCAGTH